MPSTATTRDVSTPPPIAAELVVEAVRTGGRPTLPAGRRDEVIHTLNRCVVNPVFRDAYVVALEGERQRHGLKTVGMPDFPEADVLQHGFTGLADDTLADLALDPIAVKVLVDLVNRTGPWEAENPDAAGQWLTDAVTREYGDPDPLQGSGLEPARPRFVESDRHARPRGPLWVPAAVAAALVIGVGLGFLLFGRSVDPVRDQELVLAQASTRPIATKGTEKLFEVDIQSDRKGFATVVLLRGGKDARVYPDYGGEDVAVPQRSTRKFGSLEASPGDVILVVVTATPAAETVRKAVGEFRGSLDTVPQTEARVKDALWAAGHTWAGLTKTTIATTP